MHTLRLTMEVCLTVMQVDIGFIVKKKKKVKLN